jgi:heat shock protein HslJ
MKSLKLFSLMVLAAIFLTGLSGCAIIPGLRDQGDIILLPGTSWTLIQIGGEKAEGVVTLKFEVDQLGGNGSCNNYFGSYTLDGSKITMGPLGSTMMACENMELETAYFKAMSEVAAVRFAEGQLILVDNAGKDQLVFNPMHHASLEATSWVLTGWNTGSVITSLILDTEITLEMTDGQATGSAGCNSYFSGYVVSNEKLTFDAIGNTEMYCMNPEGVMEQETGYLKVLGQVASFSIEGDSLTMLGVDGTQLLTFVVK